MSEVELQFDPSGEILHEQFRSFSQQKRTAQFGMWVFLASEILFFGALFLGLTVYRTIYSEAFAQASRETSLAWGTANTAVLLTSSLTMAFAVQFAQKKMWDRARRLILFTMALGVVFLMIKGHEWAMDISNGFFPSPSFRFDHFESRAAELFFAFYFIMTALHGLHMLIGICVLGSVVIRMRKTPQRLGTTIEICGLYWHFVDMVWIFLFPLLYLIGRTS